MISHLHAVRAGAALALGAALSTAAACGSQPAASSSAAASPQTVTQSAATVPASATTAPSSALPPLAVSDAAVSIVQPQPPAGSCHTRGKPPFVEPDPACSPGAVTAAVTQALVGRTVCAAGYAATVSTVPTVRWKEAKASRAAYGLPPTGGGYSYGYVVPLGLGGSANDPRNSWPFVAAVAVARDRLTTRLAQHVCNGTMPLHTAQSLLALDWVAAYQQYVGPLADAGVRPSQRAITAGASCLDAGDIATDAAGMPVLCSSVSGALRWRVQR